MAPSGIPFSHHRGESKKTTRFEYFPPDVCIDSPADRFITFMAGKLIDRLDSIGQRRLMGAHSMADRRISSFKGEKLFASFKKVRLCWPLIQVVIELCK
jgi:hypothetical protein